MRCFIAFNIFMLLFLSNTGSLFASSPSSLSIFAYPPRRNLDWKSPAKSLRVFLTVETVKFLEQARGNVHSVSDFSEKISVPIDYRSNMGHTIAKVHCTLPSGEVYKRWTSFSGQEYQEMTKELIMEKKLGLGALFYDYPDGFIISGQENILKLIYHNGRKIRNLYGKRVKIMPRKLQMSVSEDECQNIKDMVDFFESYHYEVGSPLKSILDRGELNNLYFSTNLDPYESYQRAKAGENTKVGGGCAPYGVALMKHTSFYHKMLDDFFQLRVKVSEKLIGNGRDKKVSIFKLLFTSKWTFKGYANREFVQYDPQLIWNFIGEVRACLGKVEYKGQKCSANARKWMRQLEKEGSGVKLATPTKLSHNRVVNRRRNLKRIIYIPGIELTKQ